MKVLVTGGAGYLGSVVTRCLLAEGHQVRALDSLLFGNRPQVEPRHQDSFEYNQGDVRSSTIVAQALSAIEAVVHLAAIVGDPACAQQPDLAQEVKQDASAQIFELSRLHSVRCLVMDEDDGKKGPDTFDCSLQNNLGTTKIFKDSSFPSFSEEESHDKRPGKT